MRRKIESIIIYIIFIVIIFISIKIPEILLEMQEDNIQMAIYRKEGAKDNIDVEVSKIYLVRAIHEIEQNSAVEINYIESFVEKNNDYEMNEFEKEIMKLQNYNIIKDFDTTNNSTIKVTNKVYTRDTDKYNIKAICLDNTSNHYDMNIEEKTGKILSIFMIKKNDLNRGIDTEELIKNYINYLELNIIDDWKYENNIMRSEKAKLVILLLEDVQNREYKLSIHSDDITANNYEFIKTK